MSGQELQHTWIDGDRLDAWIDGRRPDPMNPGEVSVWLAQLDLPDEEVRSLATLLSPDERMRAERFRMAADRHHFVVGRAILRLLLGSLLQVKPSDLRFHFGSSGKPSLDPSQNTDDMRFNVARAGALTLFGVAREQEIGIDLEYQADITSFMDIAQRFFSSAEKDILFALAGRERLRAFYALWTRKEAYLKGIGSGLGVSLDNFAVPLANAAPVRVQRQENTSVTGKPDDDERLAARTWLVYDIAVPPDYVAALATLGKISYLQQWEIECVKPTPRGWPVEPSDRLPIALRYKLITNSN
jgi:4'-phosphopantetheinyl transferase